MPSTVDEIAPSIYRLSSTLVSEISPTGFTFNQFLVDDASRSSFTPGTDPCSRPSVKPWASASWNAHGSHPATSNLTNADQ